MDAGDHTLLIGQVQDMGQRTARPLGYCQGAYVGFHLQQAAQEALARQALTAALIETPQGARIVYRGRASAAAELAGLCGIPVAALPTLNLPDGALQAMLTRYAQERAQDAFGIYIGNQDAGEVRPLAAA